MLNGSSSTEERRENVRYVVLRCVWELGGINIAKAEPNMSINNDLHKTGSRGTSGKNFHNEAFCAPS
jgi:hypothetical protein